MPQHMPQNEIAAPLAPLRFLLLETEVEASLRLASHDLGAGCILRCLSWRLMRPMVFVRAVVARSTGRPVPHWQSRVDVRVVNDAATHALSEAVRWSLYFCEADCV